MDAGHALQPISQNQDGSRPLRFARSFRVSRVSDRRLPESAGYIAMYDLILSGGTVIDPSQALHGPLDVAAKDREIAQDPPTLLPLKREPVLNVQGTYL